MTIYEEAKKSINNVKIDCNQELINKTWKVAVQKAAGVGMILLGAAMLHNAARSEAWSNGKRAGVEMMEKHVLRFAKDADTFRENCDKNIEIAREAVQNAVKGE